jgi:hypothetical protein
MIYMGVGKNKSSGVLRKIITQVGSEDGARWGVDEERASNSEMGRTRTRRVVDHSNSFNGTGPTNEKYESTASKQSSKKKKEKKRREKKNKSD